MFDSIKAFIVKIVFSMYTIWEYLLCNSYILLQIFMWTLKNDDLIGVAFIDTHIYIHSLVTLKNLIFAADVQKSVTLYRYQEQERVLSQVCRVII
jgi:cleavage and polyadenylation specificity factor subunit 1